MDFDPRVPADGAWLGRAQAEGAPHPLVVTLRDGTLFDITAREAPTVRDVCEKGDPAAYARGAPGRALCALNTTAEAGVRLLSPVDLQAVKASGVTFVVSLLERVIEEQARGEPSRAAGLRAEITELVGEDLSALKPGSAEAQRVKERLLARGVWSQYLEVGIGPDAEIFTKCQPMASVGHGAEVGLHPSSAWNNPEPEVVVIASSRGTIVGATLGNDVNLRDIEGRSALLLGKAKDNNASAALGPMIRLFDESFGLSDVEEAEVSLRVEGADGFVLDGASSMKAISRSPADLVAAAMGAHHQYPDGMALYLGTMFAPTKDRGAVGAGFTHALGDVVSVSSPSLGRLVNRVNLSTACPPWRYGASHLLRDLSGAGLL